MFRANYRYSGELQELGSRRSDSKKDTAAQLAQSIFSVESYIQSAGENLADLDEGLFRRRRSSISLPSPGAVNYGEVGFVLSPNEEVRGVMMLRQASLAGIAVEFYPTAEADPLLVIHPFNVDMQEVGERKTFGTVDEVAENLPAVVDMAEICAETFRLIRMTRQP